MTPPTEVTHTDAMVSEINRGLMVRWINADLLNRFDRDVRASIVCYDTEGMFVYAFPAKYEPTDDEWDVLTQHGVHSWSRGIV